MGELTRSGKPIVINTNNGEILRVFEKTFSTNRNKTLTVKFADDLGSGWTPNGL